jgi:drug/metabolite transporter (DMT)-like permease
MSKKFIGTLYILIAASLWGSMGIFSRYLNAAGFGAFEVTQVRVTVGFIIVGVYLLIFNRQMLKIKLKDLWCFIGTGIVSLLLFCICYFKSMEYVSISTAGVLLYTAPTFVMLMSLVLFRERLTVSKIVSLVLSFIGCALVSGIGGNDASLTGILLALASGFFYALYSIFGRYAIIRGYSSWTIVFYTFMFSSVGCAFLCDWNKITHVAFSSATNGLLCLGLGLITGFLAYIFYSMGLERIESSKASILASLEPVVGTVLAMIFFGEFPSVYGYLGIALVLGAIAALSISPKSKN